MGYGALDSIALPKSGVHKTIAQHLTILDISNNNLSNILQNCKLQSLNFLNCTRIKKFHCQDIVFLKTWYQVEIPKLYNPVTNMLLSVEERSNWQGMKTVGMLRKVKGIKAPYSEDSQYQKDPTRKEHHLRPLEIPKSLQKDLPFKYRPKTKSKWQDPVLKKRIAVVRDSHEKKKDQLMQSMKAVYNAQVAKAKQQKGKRIEDMRRRMKQAEEKRSKKMKDAKKDIFRALGKLKVKEQKHSDRVHGETE